MWFDCGTQDCCKKIQCRLDCAGGFSEHQESQFITVFRSGLWPFFFCFWDIFFLVFANGKSQVAMSSRRSGALRRSLLSSCLDGLATKTIPESPGLANLPRCLKMSFDIQISIFLRILLSACFSRQRLQARATEQSRTNFMYVCPFFFGCFDVFWQA